MVAQKTLRKNYIKRLMGPLEKAKKTDDYNFLEIAMDAFKKKYSLPDVKDSDYWDEIAKQMNFIKGPHVPHIKQITEFANNGPPPGEPLIEDNEKVANPQEMEADSSDYKPVGPTRAPTNPEEPTKTPAIKEMTTPPAPAPTPPIKGEDKMEEEEKKNEAFMKLEEDALFKKQEDAEQKEAESNASNRKEELKNNIEMNVKKTNKKENDQIISKAEDINQPRKIDSIPKNRLITENKDAATLRDDINYLFREFPDQLKNLNKNKKNIMKMSLPLLKKLHKRIVNILQPSPGMQTSGKRIGVVIDAEAYITRKVNELLVNRATESFNLPNLEPIGDDEEDRDPDVKDIGSYEIKRGPDGGLNSQKEPVYRYIPTTQDDQVEENNYDFESKRKPKRISLPKTKMRNLTQTAKREVRENPFSSIQKGHRLTVIQ